LPEETSAGLQADFKKKQKRTATAVRFFFLPQILQKTAQSDG
jgi:hypothetical protein